MQRVVYGRWLVIRYLKEIELTQNHSIIYTLDSQAHLGLIKEHIIILTEDIIVMIIKIKREDLDIKDIFPQIQIKIKECGNNTEVYFATLVS